MPRDLSVEFEQLTRIPGRYTVAEVAERLGVTTRTVERLRARHGVAGPPRPTRPLSDHDRVAQLLEDGCSAAEAGRTVGVSRSTVLRWFPDAPRFTHVQAGEASVLARLAREVLDVA